MNEIQWERIANWEEDGLMSVFSGLHTSNLLL